MGRFNRCRSRKDFQEYTLIKLGMSVTRINVTQQQLDDRLQDCLSFFFEWNFQDSIEEVVQIRKIEQIKADELEFASYTQKEEFENEQGLGKYFWTIDLPESFIGISDITPIKGSELNAEIDSDTPMADRIFDIEWNIEKNSMVQMYGSFGGRNYTQTGYDWGNGLSNYDMTRRYINLMKYEFRKTPFYNYNRFTNKVKFMTNPGAKYALVRGYKIIDEDLNSGIWSNLWLGEYYAAVMKVQWGNNLRKMKGIALPGGATIDAEGIMNEGLEEKRRLEEELKNEVANSFPILRY